MMMIRRYFPGVSIESLDEERFAMISEDALWYHNEVVMKGGLASMFGSK